MPPKDWPLLGLESRDIFLNNFKFHSLGEPSFFCGAHIIQHAIVSGVLFDI